MIFKLDFVLFLFFYVFNSPKSTTAIIEYFVNNGSRGAVTTVITIIMQCDVSRYVTGSGVVLEYIDS